MAGVITDYEITTADIQGVHVEAQPTVLRGSAQQNKQVFDKYSDMIVTHFNGLIGFLEDEISSEIDHTVLEYYRDVLGWVQD